jgi:hypothetical protein
MQHNPIILELAQYYEDQQFPSSIIWQRIRETIALGTSEIIYNKCKKENLEYFVMAIKIFVGSKVSSQSTKSLSEIVYDIEIILKDHDFNRINQLISDLAKKM